MTLSCATCWYGVPFDYRHDLYECRRYAPRPPVGSMNAYANQQCSPALLPANYWCGDGELRRLPVNSETAALQNNVSAGQLKIPIQEEPVLTYDNVPDTAEEGL